MVTTPNPEVFYSTHDWWATLMVWGIVAVCWIMGVKIIMTAVLQEGQLLAGVGALLAGMGAPWFWLTTRYKLKELSLTLISGPFFKSIDYEDIQGVSNGRKKKGLALHFRWTVYRLMSLALLWGIGYRQKTNRVFCWLYQNDVTI